MSKNFFLELVHKAESIEISGFISVLGVEEKVSKLVPIIMRFACDSFVRPIQAERLSKIFKSVPDNARFKDTGINGMLKSHLQRSFYERVNAVDNLAEGSGGQMCNPVCNS